MDFLQLVFGFVNAPLFATFLLGMFWKRATGHGAFTGLLAGTAAAAATHGLTLAENKGGWLGAVLHTFPSTMAQNFWIAIFAWSTCFAVTVAGQPAVAPETRIRTARSGLRTDQDPARFRASLVSSARSRCRAGHRLALIGLNLLFW